MSLDLARTPGREPIRSVVISFRHSQVETKSHGVDRTMTSTGPRAALIAEAVGARHAAAVAKRQADQINRLTLVSMIFLPLTFITGFFGMNFGWMTQIIGGADAFVLLGVILPTVCVALTLVWLRRSRLIRWGKESHRSKLRYTIEPEGNDELRRFP
jgi:hypothetical protein